MKKISQLLLVAFLFLIVFSFNGKTEAASSLKDIKDHWAKKEIEYLIQRGIISGYSDGTFKPNGLITKAQAAIMIGRAMGLPGQQPVDTRFPDVPASVSGSGYIHELDKIDVIWPDGDGFYRPNKLVTRGYSMFYIVTSDLLKSKLNEPVFKNPFKDVSSKNTLHNDAILRGFHYGIVKGYSDGTFRPNEVVTRAQFSVFMARALQAE